MKELSIEEKAKRYDEVIERAKKVLLDCTSEEKKVVEYISPELKESEGEKIRKDIIWCLKHSDIKESNPINPHVTTIIKDAIAWLEKQGEQKPVNRLKTTASNWYVCEMEVANENMTTAFHRGEVYYCPKDGYIDVNGALFEVGTLDVFRLATKEEIPQPKQEWSEKDEHILNNIYDFIAENLLDKNRGICADECLNWLKSLRSQSHWKPSEEQINALAKNVEYVNVGCTQHILKELLEDLKKLRGE